MKKILKGFFVFIIPVSILLHFLTLGHWTVEYEGNGETYNIAGVRTVELGGGIKKYYCDDVRGFPFPSHGRFMPVVNPASSDWEERFSFTYATINLLLKIVLSGFIYFFIMRKIHIKKSVLISSVCFIYLIGLPCFWWIVFWNKEYYWFNDFKIISYHFLWF